MDARDVKSNAKIMDYKDKIFVAGHKGLVGSAIERQLKALGYQNIITRSHAELDLTDQAQVVSFFDKEKPDYVFMAAAKVGGISANNSYRAEFIYENLMQESNIIHASFISEVKRLIFLANADIYPKNCPQPAKEEYLLTGPLEPTCEPFSVAKIAGIKMCESYNRQYNADFLVVIPPNVYGPNQQYDVMNSQVLPSLLKRFHDVKNQRVPQIVIWGTGNPIRDFLFVDDVADASIFLMQKEKLGDYMFNLGTGLGSSIKDLAAVIRQEVGFRGEIIFDENKPDGAPKKMLDASRIVALGWRPKTSLREGVKITYESFLAELKNSSLRAPQINKMQVCEKDINRLDELSYQQKVVRHQQPENYKNRVVIKPWGYEFLVFENDCVAVWFLHLKKGHSTSMHCHVRKKTSLIMLAGEAISNILTKRKSLKGGEALIIDKGVFHSTKALSDNGIFLLEIETPSDKTDLLRAEDRYGRENSGYEGITEMQSHELATFNHFSFQEEDSAYDFGAYSVSMEIFQDSEDFRSHFKPRPRAIYSSCRGALRDQEGNIVLDLGESQKAEKLSSYKIMNLTGKLVLLCSEPKND
jgi:GDP-L-fucose synthase